MILVDRLLDVRELDVRELDVRELNVFLLAALRSILFYARSIGGGTGFLLVKSRHRRRKFQSR